MTPAQLRAKAKKLEQKADTLYDQAAVLLYAAEELERLGLARIPDRPLTGGEVETLAREQSRLKERAQLDSVTGMVSQARLNISKGRTLTNPDPFISAFQAAGYSLRGLAARLGVSPSALTGYRQTIGTRRARRVPRKIAEHIEKLTGFKATAANWPTGIADDDR